MGSFRRRYLAVLSWSLLEPLQGLDEVKGMGVVSWMYIYTSKTRESVTGAFLLQYKRVCLKVDRKLLESKRGGSPSFNMSNQSSPSL